ncbi:PILR alpha-associated neural protein [Scyliorhinus canicula]|uniref:PILR alpha-associated neural protein n=1 Tax=Scyliorhinus canicula TaxID=7830 RepID=UPI0018F52919|nr:PILR alpha-associated neural protein [Scyliorhinus canicula]
MYAGTRTQTWPPLLWLLMAGCVVTGGQAGPRTKGHIGRGRRQAVRAYVGMESSTPANLQRAQGSSQYPWAIIWGPTAGEEGSTETTAFNVGTRSLHPFWTTPAKDSAPQDPGWINLGETPATLRPFLFGRTSQGTDPQLYVTVSISVLIVLAAISIILKFCWDRNWCRGREGTRSQGTLTEESCQALTGPPGMRRGIGGFFSPYEARAQSLESDSTSPIELEDSLALAGKGVRFQRSRIPLVNL